MPGCDASASPVARSQAVTTFMTPAGRPAAWRIRANSTVDAGACSDGLTTHVLPAASSGASFQVSRRSGLFHGVMQPTTPTGSRRV